MNPPSGMIFEDYLSLHSEKDIQIPSENVCKNEIYSLVEYSYNNSFNPYTCEGCYFSGFKAYKSLITWDQYYIADRLHHYWLAHTNFCHPCQIT